MCQCIESIRLENGQFSNLNYHRQRMQNAIDVFFPGCTAPDLKYYLLQQKIPQKGLFKCRIIFDVNIISCEFQPYVRKDLRALKLVDVEIPTTLYKGVDRQAFLMAFEQREDCDDVLMVRDGLITDASYSNVAFFDGKQWLTPHIPLIYGTRRANLLDAGLIVEADISPRDLGHFSKICLFNAMIAFGEMEFSFLQDKLTGSLHLTRY